MRDGNRFKRDCAAEMNDESHVGQINLRGIRYGTKMNISLDGLYAMSEF